MRAGARINKAHVLQTIAAIAVSYAIAQAQLTPPFDVVIRNGRVIDGTGSPWQYADIAIKGDTIVAVGRVTGGAARVVDATGLVVAPGFIDMLGQSEFSILVDNRAASKVLQGVTTEITGEGASIAPLSDRMIREGGVRNGKTPFKEFSVVPDWRSLDEYFARVARTRSAINVGTFVGAGGIRDHVIGRKSRPPGPAEMEAMKSLVAEAMKDGALGLSTSLQYVPDRFASTDEIVELAKVAAQYGGIYITHQRSEGDRILESLDEVFTIARRAQIPAEIFHLKTANRANWGKMPAVLKRIDEARARGLDVTANQYPYTASSNPLEACLPVWVREGGFEKMASRLRDPAQRERIKAEMNDAHARWENQYYGAGGAGGILIVTTYAPSLRKYEGLTLAQIGRQHGKDPRDVAMDIVVADRALTRAVNFVMSEDDVRAALVHPLVSVGTDSAAMAQDGPLARSKSHPRSWGSFPRILGKYVREERLLTLEDAVRKMTSRPAARVRLVDRGLLRPGMKADITVFNPSTIADKATFNDPNQYSVGMEHVLVNGEFVVFNGSITAARPGRVLRGSGHSSSAR